MDKFSIIFDFFLIRCEIKKRKFNGINNAITLLKGIFIIKIEIIMFKRNKGIRSAILNFFMFKNVIESNAQKANGINFTPGI